MMAEALGVAASGMSIAALAVQVASSVVKIKVCWGHIMDAPEEISFLLDELDDLCLVLSDIEEDQRWNPTSPLELDNTTASKCLDHCRRGANRLKELVEGLNSDIHSPNQLRRKWASTKVVLKKEKIKRYKSRLKAAIRLLSLSHQSYTRFDPVDYCFLLSL